MKKLCKTVLIGAGFLGSFIAGAVVYCGMLLERGENPREERDTVIETDDYIITIIGDKADINNGPNYAAVGRRK